MNMTVDNRLADILANGADGAQIASDPVKGALDAMESAAVAMGVALAGAESAAALAAKDWGCQYLNLVKVHNHDGDSLAQRTRDALGWKDLKGEAGSVIKRRFNTWRSNVGVLSGRWDEVSDEERTALLGGTRSFITVYKALIEKDNAEKKAKLAAEKAAEKAAETDPNAVTLPDAIPTDATHSVGSHISALMERMAIASDDELSAAYDVFDAMVKAFDARINAATDVAVNG